MENLNQLYQNLIKEHGKNPINFEKREDAKNVIKAYNPICGDQFNFYVEVKEDKVEQVHFSGFGCMISKAASSVLVQRMVGMSVAEAKGFALAFLAFIKEDENNMEDDELKVFGEVKKFPSRKECVTLSWEAMVDFLENYEAKI